ncbi:hypothetical protein JW826_04125 [Candidatus Woesearchaeota archaeon]|nr:hypothetical protein [Candidatus Woesearchaeota archaeon]
MKLSQTDIKRIVEFVKKEPRTVQDVSKLIGRSWVTTESYLQQIKEDTGLIDIKTFRKGSQAALKIVFPASSSNVSSDDLKDRIFQKIRIGRTKNDLDFMGIYQFIPASNKKAYSEQYEEGEITKGYPISHLLRRAENYVYVFSGNLSFLNTKENGKSVLSVMEELLKKKISVKILCRVNLASLSNISKLSLLIKKYPDLIEVRHSYHPLRGFLIDGKLGRFKNEESALKYKKGELVKNTRIFYEFYDHDWISWLEKVFWSLFRVSLDYESRAKEIRKIF